MRTGSFGYLSRGKAFELVAGSVLVGHPGDETPALHVPVKRKGARKR